MINLRYHIVSITAVFLALGIGLAFGAAFIDRATVDALNNNLTEIENQNSALEDENGRLRDLVGESDDVEQTLVEEGLDRMLGGHLDEVPVLLLVADGADDDAVEHVAAALAAAGASSAGVVRATERIALDDDSELDDLREILSLPDAPAGQLRIAVIRQLRRILATASRPAPADQPDPDPDRNAAVPGLVQALLDGGFLDLDEVEEGGDLIPAAGLRVIVLVGPEGDESTDGLLRPLVDALATPTPVDPLAAPLPLVVAEPSVGDADGEAPERYLRTLRDDEVVGARVSTVDTVDTFAGLSALVLAVADAGEGRLGHYGRLDDAQLLPAPAP